MTAKHYRVLESSTGRLEWFDTSSAEYLTWLLLPEGTDHVSDHLAASGRWEWDLIRLALRLLPPRGTFVDVGAHAGPWALMIAKARDDLRVEAFEPHAVLFQQLCGNIFLNHLTNVRPHQLALGAHPGRMQLRLPDKKNLGSSTLAQNGVLLDTVTVKTLAEMHVEPDVMKLSVNGYEERVLEGGFEVLRRRRPFVFFDVPEVHNPRERAAHDSLLAYIQKLDYVHTKVSARRSLAFHESKRAVVEAQQKA